LVNVYRSRRKRTAGSFEPHCSLACQLTQQLSTEFHKATTVFSEIKFTQVIIFRVTVQVSRSTDLSLILSQRKLFQQQWSILPVRQPQIFTANCYAFWCSKHCLHDNGTRPDLWPSSVYF